MESYNRQLDEAWKFFDAKKSAVLPIVRRELTLELQREQPNNMLLLDIGYYLRLQESAADKELGKAALFKLDPAAEIVYVNQQQFFDFAYSVVADQDPRVLPFLDKAFLRQKMTAYVPQHALGLDETLVCVFLYGVHGQVSEAHLRNLLKEKALARKIIEILIWIGTPDSVPDVKAAMFADRSYETFNRGTTFMMKVGGPAGRAVMLALNPKDFMSKSTPRAASVNAKPLPATSIKIGDTQLGSSGLQSQEVVPPPSNCKSGRHGVGSVVTDGEGVAVGKGVPHLLHEKLSLLTMSLHVSCHDSP